MQDYQVVMHRDGNFQRVVSGLGRNKGTWDTLHSKATAQKYARLLQSTVREDSSVKYKAEAFN